MPNFPDNPLRRMMQRQVRALFNDQARGERPVQRSARGLYSPDSVIWRVHGDITTMMVGGISALLLQMLHPAALAGIWDHSNFRTDMLGRLRRTARFISETTFADRDIAEAAIARVRDVHARVSGTSNDGATYTANDPHLLAWVHVAEAICFLDAWRRYAEPQMSRADQDRYFAEFAAIARALGTDPVPETRAEAEAVIQTYRPELRSDERTREVARLILNRPPPNLRSAPVQEMVMQAAVDLLPDWARKQHGLSGPRLTKPAVRGSTFLLASSLRWAFSGR
ncbi:DUF2236 domain-containing protein [Sphingobium sp. SCG-1]|uniref:oxygenase MpaB family protein n=1 Tax=Sphingobium sp. SCG-1 TaxID=2072936 RepID=UPI000CD69A9C|nr:oxygenase MpaB family protein [Sphingobium sp. SCG-1]AUW57364.1 DUF2236 domain-containing protein [Sphingobium sp. SCG-1]